MTNLYLIRHADYLYDLVDGQYPKQDQGLTEKGRLQAEKLRDRLSVTGEIAPDVFICSTERGAKETADIIAPVFGMSVTFDHDVVEWRSEDGTLSTEEFMGAWNSLTDAQKPYYRWVDGCETLLEFSTRAHATLNRILSTHQGQTILVLTHGAFIQMSFAYCFGYSVAVPQRATAEVNRTSITHWELNDKGKWLLKRANDCHHLD